MYHLISYLIFIIYTLLYMEEEQKQEQKGRAKGQTERAKEERGPGRRMPPTSSPVPRLASVPSAALNVHTIASAHHLARSQHRPG